MNLEKLKKILQNNNQPKFRLEQIKKAIYQDGISAFSEISVLPKDLRDILEKEIKILSFEAEEVLISDDKQSVKALLKLTECHPEFISEPVLNSIQEFKEILKPWLRPAGKQVQYDKSYFIETVLLSSGKGNWTVCVSSQVGCPMNCAFCATGKEGFKRNLTTEEITDQILFWRQYLKNYYQPQTTNHKLTNIVYMGMGEPFLNWENVKKSLEDLTDPEIFGFSSRSISVSTAGIIEGIEELYKNFPQINLAISLHFPDDERREKYMPINKKYNLEKIKETLKKYFEKGKRKIFIEYIMFENLNDKLQDARKLSEYLKSIGHAYLLHVNLIPFNAKYEINSPNSFKASSGEKILAFKKCLEQNNINVTVRKSLGQDIQGACGQLVQH
jgi:adenine C2-methylase RlmN of 23S rRNA A2503 and tRNA A37